MSAPLTSPNPLARLPDLNAPPADGRKRFRVTVIEWLSHVIILDAEDANSAEGLAEQLWSEAGGEVFRFKDQGVDGFQVEEVEGGVA